VACGPIRPKARPAGRAVAKERAHRPGLRGIAELRPYAGPDYYFGQRPFRWPDDMGSRKLMWGNCNPQTRAVQTGQSAQHAIPGRSSNGPGVRKSIGQGSMAAIPSTKHGQSRCRSAGPRGTGQILGLAGVPPTKSEGESRARQPLPAGRAPASCFTHPHHDARGMKPMGRGHFFRFGTWAKGPQIGGTWFRPMTRSGWVRFPIRKEKPFRFAIPGTAKRPFLQPVDPGPARPKNYYEVGGGPITKQGRLEESNPFRPKVARRGWSRVTFAGFPNTFVQKRQTGTGRAVSLTLGGRKAQTFSGGRVGAGNGPNSHPARGTPPAQPPAPPARAGFSAFPCGHSPITSARDHHDRPKRIFPGGMMIDDASSDPT